MVDATERPQRDLSRAVCHGPGKARGDCAGICEENAENAEAGDQFGVVAREVDSVMEV